MKKDIAELQQSLLKHCKMTMEYDHINEVLRSIEIDVPSTAPAYTEHGRVRFDTIRSEVFAMLRHFHILLDAHDNDA